MSADASAREREIARQVVEILNGVSLLSAADQRESLDQFVDAPERIYTLARYVEQDLLGRLRAAPEVVATWATTQRPAKAGGVDSPLGRETIAPSSTPLLNPTSLTGMVLGVLLLGNLIRQRVKQLAENEREDKAAPGASTEIDPQDLEDAQRDAEMDPQELEDAEDEVEMDSQELEDAERNRSDIKGRSAAETQHEGFERGAGNRIAAPGRVDGSNSTAKPNRRAARIDAAKLNALMNRLQVAIQEGHDPEKRMELTFEIIRLLDPDIKLSEIDDYFWGIIVGFFYDGLVGNIVGVWDMVKLAIKAWWWKQKVITWLTEKAGRYVVGDDFNEEKAKAVEVIGLFTQMLPVLHQAATRSEGEMTGFVTELVADPEAGLEKLMTLRDKFEAVQLALIVELLRYLKGKPAEEQGRIIGAILYEFLETVVMAILSAGVAKVVTASARMADLVKKLRGIAAFGDKIDHLCELLLRFARILDRSGADELGEISADATRNARRAGRPHDPIPIDIQDFTDTRRLTPNGAAKPDLATAGKSPGGPHPNSDLIETVTGTPRRGSTNPDLVDTVPRSKHGTGTDGAPKGPDGGNAAPSTGTGPAGSELPPRDPEMLRLQEKHDEAAWKATRQVMGDPNHPLHDLSRDPTFATVPGLNEIEQIDETVDTALRFLPRESVERLFRPGANLSAEEVVVKAALGHNGIKSKKDFYNRRHGLIQDLTGTAKGAPAHGSVNPN